MLMLVGLTAERGMNPWLVNSELLLQCVALLIQITLELMCRCFGPSLTRKCQCFAARLDSTGIVKKSLNKNGKAVVRMS